MVIFDIGGRSPRAKEATQDARRSRVGQPAEMQALQGDDPDAPPPSPFSAFLRTKGALNAVVEAVAPLLEKEFFKGMRTNCTIVLKCASVSEKKNYSTKFVYTHLTIQPSKPSGHPRARAPASVRSTPHSSPYIRVKEQP